MTESKLELEKLVDKTSIWQVLSDLVDICYDKDDHLRHTWQDTVMAGIWRDAGDVIYSIIDKVQ